MKLFVAGMVTMSKEDALQFLKTDCESVEQIRNPTILFALGVPLISIWIGEELPDIFNVDKFTHVFDVEQVDFENLFKE